MRIGLLSGSGVDASPAASAESESVETRYGKTQVRRRQEGGAEIIEIARHGPGHERLSNHVPHRANVAALAELGVDCVVGVTVCGAVNPRLALGSLIVFDDLHFLANRLADGSLCTFYETAGEANRGHWIFDTPFAEGLRRGLVAAALEAATPATDGGCYGHVDGPRFNSKAEIRSLGLAGVDAVSQTAGPETVLCGEAGLPYALLGYITDYAAGVRPPAPIEELRALVAASGPVTEAVVERFARAANAQAPERAGTVYRFG